MSVPTMVKVYVPFVVLEELDDDDDEPPQPTSIKPTATRKRAPSSLRPVWERRLNDPANSIPAMIRLAWTALKKKGGT